MKGRPPKNNNIVPMTTGDGQGLDPQNHDDAAKAKAKELKPRGLPRNVSRIWDRLAWTVAHATIGRLKPHTAETFKELCFALARVEFLREKLREKADWSGPQLEGDVETCGGETYVVEGRNGNQIKSRPEVAQYNESLSKFIQLARDFGMTPAAERGIQNGTQGELFQGDPAEQYFG